MPLAQPSRSLCDALVAGERRLNDSSLESTLKSLRHELTKTLYPFALSIGQLLVVFARVVVVVLGGERVVVGLWRDVRRGDELLVRCRCGARDESRRCCEAAESVGWSTSLVGGDTRRRSQ